MHSIRLGVSGADATPWGEIARRLRGATIDVSPGPEPAETCHAAVFAGALRPAQETVARFLRAGKHVLLASEPCWPRDELEALLDASRQSGVQFVVMNPERYLPSRQLIKQHLPDKLGAAGLVRVHRWQPSETTPIPEPLGLPGPLVRDLDVVLWLLGRPPNLVYALERPRGGRYVQVHLGFPGGGMALIDYDGGLPAGDGYQSLSVVGSSGAAYADDHQNVQLVYRGGRPQAVRTEEGLRQHTALVQEFVDALHAGRDLSAHTEAWRSVLAVVEGVRQSLASGQAVEVEGR